MIGYMVKYCSNGTEASQANGVVGCVYTGVKVRSIVQRRLTINDEETEDGVSWLSLAEFMPKKLVQTYAHMRAGVE